MRGEKVRVEEVREGGRRGEDSQNNNLINN